MPLPIVAIAGSLLAGFIGELIYDKTFSDKVTINGDTYDVQAFDGSDHAVIGMNDLTGAVLLRSIKPPYDEVWKYPDGSYSRELKFPDDPSSTETASLFRMSLLTVGTLWLWKNKKIPFLR